MQQNDHEDRELVRFVEAVTIGAIADREFDLQCRRRGLSVNVPTCLLSPLEYLAVPTNVLTARRDQ